MKPAHCLLLVLAAALGMPRGASGQDDLKSASAVRLTFAHVDSLAPMFGVDTAAVRRHITDRLNSGRITVVAEEHAPVLDVTILVHTATELTTDGWVSVALTFGAARLDGNGRSSPLWDGQSPAQRITSLRLLPALVIVAADRVVDQLILARDHARGAGGAPRPARSSS